MTCSRCWGSAKAATGAKAAVVLSSVVSLAVRVASLAIGAVRATMAAWRAAAYGLQESGV